MKSLRLAAVLLVAGCAKGGTDASDAPSAVVDSPPPVDSHVVVDGSHSDASLIDSPSIDAAHDAPVMIDAAMIDAAMIDAPIMIDAAHDAPVMVDAPMVDAAVMHDAAPDAMAMVDAGCTITTTEVLLNPAFDLTPRGASWTEVPFDTTLNLITDDAGTPAAQSAPYRAWLGGVLAPDIFSTATDQLYQAITIPANTTKLELTGFYAVGSDETTTTSVYDTGDLAITQTNGSPIEDVLALTNLSKTTVPWTPIDYTFTTNLSGQTVRLRFLANNDFTNATSFFFDTMSLKATHCP